MRTIDVSTDVFSAIWSNRLPGEETEDAILGRLLSVDGKPTIQCLEEKGRGKVLWRDDVKAALVDLGGSAHLDEIYKQVRSIRMKEGRRLPRSANAIVRRELEYNSSDSESFTGKFDWFRSVRGIGAGHWGLRTSS